MATAANTPTTYYVDTKSGKTPCDKDFAKIQKECGPDDHPDHKNDKSRETRSKFRKLLGKKYKEKGHDKVLSRGGTDNKSWMAEHCDFLWIPPGADSHADFLKKLDELRNDLAGTVEAELKQIVEQAKDKIKQEALDLAKKKAGQATVRAGGRWTAGTAGAMFLGGGAVVTEGIATIWNLWDMASTGYEVTTKGYNAVKELGAIDDIIKDYKQVGDELERLGRQARDDPQKAIADFMAGVAKTNSCVRARRCSLVPKGKANLLGGDGCCPGQTGHHLIPDAAVKDAGCPGYNYDEAPTVCAEGTGNAHGGSHGMLHNRLDKRMSAYIERRKKNTMSYEEYRNQAMMTFYETFPESMCSRQCLQAQLDAHYKCKGKDLKTVSGKGGTDKDVSYE